MIEKNTYINTYIVCLNLNSFVKHRVTQSCA